MLGYYIRLALIGFRRTPGTTAIMICAIALGIATCVVTLTVYDAAARNPIWWKGDRLYAVTIDSWDPNQPFDPSRPGLPPPELAYKDAVALLGSDIPERKVAMFRTQDVVTRAGPDARPVPIATRVTTADFFSMFDVPFLYGGGWSAAADHDADAVIVLSRALNDQLFGGTDSVGRTLRWNDRAFRVIGVLADWFPLPKFYDLTRGAFQPPEDAYVPFGWARALGRMPNGGPIACWQNDPITSFAQFLHSDCVWLQMWVELPSAAARARYQAFLDGYWDAQRKAGRFPRPRDNRLTSVPQWLVDQRVVQNDSRVLVGVALAFLVICLLNTVGILLAKFLKAAPRAAVRRALGATRRQIALQHLTEAALVAAGGGILGLALSALGLSEVHALYASGSIGRGGYQEITHFGGVSVIWSLVLAVAAALGAGLYPAWRAGRLPPARYLKEG